MSICARGNISEAVRAFPPCQVSQIKHTGNTMFLNLEHYNNAIIIDTTDRNTHALWEAKVENMPLRSLCYIHMESSSAHQMSYMSCQHIPFSQHRECCNTVEV